MTTELDRRSFVQAGSALTAGAVAAAAIGAGEAVAQTPQPAPGATAQPAAAPKPKSFDMKPMPFDPKKIKGISEKLLISHYENNYGGAVKRLNAILEQLAGLALIAAEPREIQLVQDHRIGRDQFLAL